MAIIKCLFGGFVLSLAVNAGDSVRENGSSPDNQAEPFAHSYPPTVDMGRFLLQASRY